MPWWAIIYLFLFAALCVAAVWDDDREGRSLGFLVCAVLSHATIIYLFIGFWQPGLRIGLGLLWQCLFVFAIGWQIFQAREDFRATRVDPELSANERRYVPVVAVICVWLFDLPAYVIAGLTAFRG